ncbi:branched-chain amino acid ABC transporter permease [Ramlibacter sp. AW1]|uniref:Branched-chain amino acid ABC transporter permease n=1 Tax=Ramlibacter aurantiacus TaxID=2801330 RepID=A0A936ZFM5_9BURK|nr:branched-chain amino acid ABC transporter permease [Ramlibacter aurantiacus]MBL0420042.1 branched-chain amino acid ABC transporter permease [Ramlibacter aurantiacus]
MTPEERTRHRAAFYTHRFGRIDAALAAFAVAVWWLWPLYLPLAVNVIVMIILVMALDLALGWGGIDALGHAAFYGLGAYWAANWAMHLSPEPITGLVTAGLAAAALGAVTGLAVLRARGLTQIMLTLTVATLMYEIANAAKQWTGGDDGLTGFAVAPLFGAFEFSMMTSTSYGYALGVLLVVYLLCRWLVNSPFGLSIRGIRENPTRMRVLGIPVDRRLLLLYTISAFFAGIAGALAAQTTQAVGLDSLAFVVSANAVIMLVLGGAGTLYGAFLGAMLFVVVSDRAAALDPANWLLGLGLMLILMVRYAPDGVFGLLQRGKREARKD